MTRPTPSSYQNEAKVDLVNYCYANLEFVTDFPSMNEVELLQSDYEKD